MSMLEKHEKSGIEENKKAVVNGVCEICGEKACKVPSGFFRYGNIPFRRYECDPCNISWVEPRIKAGDLY